MSKSPTSPTSPTSSSSLYALGSGLDAVPVRPAQPDVLVATLAASELPELSWRLGDIVKDPTPVPNPSEPPPPPSREPPERN
jgi:hypothetical protein